MTNEKAPTTVVVGASRGIGLALCKLLHARGDHVVATSRSRSAELQALGVEVLEGVEITSADSVATFARTIAKRPIDNLVVMAGVMAPAGLADLDFDSIHEQLAINAVGPLRVAHALLGNLHEGSKVFFVTSRMGSIGDNSSGGYYGYRMSKAALNMAGKSLALDLRPRGIAVALLHPGMVRTDMTRGGGQLAPEESALMLVKRMDELTLATTGVFLHANGEALPW
jgi:NAD(P)-dependent dehydrogenase (short-subunit alcohol dehydrogenase family)